MSAPITKRARGLSFAMTCALWLTACPLSPVPTPDVTTQLDVTGPDTSDLTEPDTGPVDIGQDTLSDEGDGTGDEGPMDTDTGPVYGPEPIAGTLSTFVEVLLDQPALQVINLAQDRYLLATQEELYHLDSVALLTIPQTEGLDPILVRDAIVLGDGSILVTSDDEFFLIVMADEGAVDVLHSPLSDSFSDDPIEDLEITHSGALERIWIASQGGVHLLEGDELTALNLEDLTTPPVQLLKGPPVDGIPAAIWLRGPSSILALVQEGAQWVALVEQPELATNSASVDAMGQLWAVHDDVILRRSQEGFWYTIVLPEAPSVVSGAPLAADTWIEANGSARYHHRDGTTYEATGIPDGTFAGTDSQGRLLILGTDQVFRVNAGRSITFSGLGQGDLLVNATEVTINPAFPELVDTLTAEVDGATVSVSTNPYQVTLDPENLEDGTYQLIVTVQYSDMPDPLEGSLSFQVTHVIATWDVDISPVVEEKCSECHGLNGFVSYKLFTKEQWIENIDGIIAALETNLMPPSPLPDDEFVTLVKIWKDLGFPE